MLLGEARSKCEHVTQVPLHPKTAENLHLMYLVKGAAATTAIEGNTLTEEQVSKRLDGTLRLSPSKEYQGIEVDNILAACNWLLQEVAEQHGAPPLNPDTIREFNRRILANLELEDGVISGEFRNYPVGVLHGRYRGAPAEDCELLVERLCEWLSNLAPEEGAIDGVGLAILKAILAHLYLAWIHPFGDGNGRTARMLELLILLSSGVPSVATHLLSNHYNQTRAEYYRQLQRSSASGGDILPFVHYALSGFVEGLREQIEHIRIQHLQTIWRDFIHEHFEDKNSLADGRRQKLILDISEARGPIPIAKLRELTPRVASAYARTSPRTLSRDLAILAEMKLVSISDEGVTASRDQILALLPVREAGGGPSPDSESLPQWDGAEPSV